MLPRMGDGAEREEDGEVVPSVCSVAQALRIFCTESLTFCRGCDRTLRPTGSGGRSLPGYCSASILPGLYRSIGR
jgi:hypothetical protein